MSNKNTGSKTENKILLKQFRGIDKLFAQIEKDKTLPTFVEHVALCIVLGTSDRVNLNTMHPDVCRKLNTFFSNSNQQF
jgi:hypothetical protein